MAESEPPAASFTPLPSGTDPIDADAERLTEEARTRAALRANIAEERRDAIDQLRCTTNMFRAILTAHLEKPPRHPKTGARQYLNPNRPHLWEGLVDYFAEEWERLRECSLRFNERAELPPLRIDSHAAYMHEVDRLETFCRITADRWEAELRAETAGGHAVPAAGAAVGEVEPTGNERGGFPNGVGLFTTVIVGNKRFSLYVDRETEGFVIDRERYPVSAVDRKQNWEVLKQIWPPGRGTVVPGKEVAKKLGLEPTKVANWVGKQAFNVRQLVEFLAPHGFGYSVWRSGTDFEWRANGD